MGIRFEFDFYRIPKAIGELQRVYFDVPSVLFDHRGAAKHSVGIHVSMDSEYISKIQFQDIQGDGEPLRGYSRL